MTGEAETQEQSIESLAMNIVYQICDVVVPNGIEGVRIRQANNDMMIDFTKTLITRASIDARIELLNKLIKDEDFVDTASNADHPVEFDAVVWAEAELATLEKERNLLP